VVFGFERIVDPRVCLTDSNVHVTIPQECEVFRSPHPDATNHQHLRASIEHYLNGDGGQVEARGRPPFPAFVDEALLDLIEVERMGQVHGVGGGDAQLQVACGVHVVLCRFGGCWSSTAADRQAAPCTRNRRCEVGEKWTVK
jgi:hypothetical protein